MPSVISSFGFVQFHTLFHIEPFSETLLLGELMTLTRLKEDIRWHLFIKDFFKEYCTKGHYGQEGWILIWYFIFNIFCLLVQNRNSVTTKNHSQLEARNKQYVFSVNTTHWTHIFWRILKEIFGIQYFINFIKICRLLLQKL